MLNHFNQQQNDKLVNVPPLRGNCRKAEFMRLQNDSGVTAKRDAKLNGWVNIWPRICTGPGKLRSRHDCYWQSMTISSVNVNGANGNFRAGPTWNGPSRIIGSWGCIGKLRVNIARERKWKGNFFVSCETLRLMMNDGEFVHVASHFRGPMTHVNSWNLIRVDCGTVFIIDWRHKIKLTSSKFTMTQPSDVPSENHRWKVEDCCKVAFLIFGCARWTIEW